MSLERLTGGILEINNEIIPHTSVSLVTGKGERGVNAQASGGGSVSLSVGDNIETKVGKITITVDNTTDVIEKFNEWHDNRTSNFIVYTKDDFVRTLTEATIVNDPEIAEGVDATFDIEFNGQPLV